MTQPEVAAASPPVEHLPSSSHSTPSMKDSHHGDEDVKTSSPPAHNVPTTDSVEKLIILSEEVFRGGFWANRKCTAFAMIMYICSFTLGYELGVTGGFLALPAFIEKFGVLDEVTGKHQISESFQQGLFALWRVGAIVALVVVWWAYRYIGRVRVFQLGLFCFLLAIIVEIAATSHATFLFGRFLMGVGDSLSRSGSFLWVAECTAAQLRNASSFIYSIKTAAGVVIAYTVSRACSHGLTSRYYRIPLLIGIAPQALSCLLSIVLPESPRWLASQGRIDEARNSLVRLRGKQAGSHNLVEDELQSIIAGLSYEKRLQGSLTTWQTIGTAFKGTDKRRTLLALSTATFFVFSGYEFISTGDSYLFKSVGEKDPFKYLIIAKSSSLVGSIIGLFFADRLRRRQLLIGSFAISCVAMLGIGITSTRSPEDLAIHPRIVLLTTFTSLGAFAFYGGIYTTLSTVAIELPSQVLRAWTYSVVAAASLVLSLINDLVQPKIINTTGLNWGGKYALFFAVTAFLIILWVWFFLPETAGVTLEEMDLLFEHRVEPRKFRKWTEEHRRLQNEENVKREA